MFLTHGFEYRTGDFPLFQSLSDRRFDAVVITWASGHVSRSQGCPSRTQTFSLAVSVTARSFKPARRKSASAFSAMARPTVRAVR